MGNALRRYGVGEFGEVQNAPSKWRYFVEIEHRGFGANVLMGEVPVLGKGDLASDKLKPELSTLRGCDARSAAR
jgi:hypothetical protein